MEVITLRLRFDNSRSYKRSLWLIGHIRPRILRSSRLYLFCWRGEITTFICYFPHCVHRPRALYIARENWMMTRLMVALIRGAPLPEPSQNVSSGNCKRVVRRFMVSWCLDEGSVKIAGSKLRELIRQSCWSQPVEKSEQLLLPNIKQITVLAVYINDGR